MRLCRRGLHEKEGPGRCVLCRRASNRALNRGPARKRARAKLRGEVGSPKRAAYNEQRRLKSKLALLKEIEANRKHKESLREFITRRAA